MKNFGKIILGLMILSLVFYPPVTTMLFLTLLVFCGVWIYSFFYFRGSKFNAIKESITDYINDCNELNTHIEELKSSYVGINRRDYGEATYSNISVHNYKKKGLNRKFAPNIYDCSRQVCSSAQVQPFKYICKCFNIKSDEQTLAKFEEVLNNFLAAEEGKTLLENKKNQILSSINKDIPFIIRKCFKIKLEQKLGFKEITLNELYFPEFIFRYVSPGGNAGTQFSVTMDIPMLERFIAYINENIKRSRSAEGQRKLMTKRLREYIKEKDNYTCQKCGNSIYQGPNLLLEVDHKIPIARGGLTEENNLQTLCWKCNRSKGARVD